MSGATLGEAVEGVGKGAAEVASSAVDDPFEFAGGVVDFAGAGFEEAAASIGELLPFVVDVAASGVVT